MPDYAGIYRPNVGPKGQYEEAHLLALGAFDPIAGRLSGVKLRCCSMKAGFGDVLKTPQSMASEP
jgi:hypothetical protein